MTVGTYTLKFDATGGGTPAEDITGDLLSCRLFRGRQDARALGSHSVPGYFQAKLLNRNGQYSSRNASGPYFGQLVSGRRLKFELTAPTASVRFNGWVRTWKPQAAGSAIVELEGITLLGRLMETRILSPTVTNSYTGEVIDAILDAANVAAGDRDIETGTKLIEDWWTGGDFAGNLLQEIVDTELGFLFDAKDGKLTFVDTTSRYSGAGLTSQATFSDDPADAGSAAFYLLGATFDEPVDSVFNRVQARVTQHDVGTAGTGFAWAIFGTPVWQNARSFSLAPGESRTLIAELVPFDFTDVDNRVLHCDHMLAWLDPVVTGPGGTLWGANIRVDGVSPSDVSEALSEQNATSCALTITNNHATLTATILTASINGAPVFNLKDTLFQADDSTSQNAYGIRQYPFTSKWLASVNDAQDQVDYILGKTKDPRAQMRVPFEANEYFADLLPLELNDRVTVRATELFTNFAVDEDFFIEGIEEEIDFQYPIHKITFTLSAAGATEVYWILGVSTLDTDTFLGW